LARRASLWLLAVTLLAGLSGCGGRGSTADDAAGRTTSTGVTPRIDPLGNVVPEGQDWSPEGHGEGSRTTATADPGAGAAGDDTRRPGITVDSRNPCGTTTIPDYDPAQAPPGFDPKAPLAEPANDFPMTATISPEEGDRGSKVTITAIAVGKPNALATVLGRFYDRDGHGMQANKFTDATGRATFEGYVPDDAPMGETRIAVAVNTRSGESAVKTLRFLVTGPGCEGET
jgi:hypothetical protein